MTSTITAKASERAQVRDRRIATSASLLPLAILILGAGSGALYFWARDLHRFTQWVAAYIGLFIGQAAFYVVAIHVVTRWSDRLSTAARWITLALIVFFAIAFRAVLAPQRPFLSSDVYRYAWDGRVQASGVNPYRYVPDDPQLAALRDDKVFPNISSDDHRWLSPYPPAAQAVFFLVASVRPMSVIALKALMSSFDVITMLALMLVLARSGIDPTRAVIFAWHPLLIFEGAHSGHIDSLFIAFVALALLAWSSKKYALTGVALALATLVKFYPILLLPAFMISNRDEEPSEYFHRESPSRAPGLVFGAFIHKRNLSMLGAFVSTVALAYVPYLSAGKNLFGFLGGYVNEEGFAQNGARYFALEAIRNVAPIPTSAFIILAVICFATFAGWALLKPKRSATDVARTAMPVIGAFLMLTTPRYAWYYAWLIPFLCFVPSVGWLYLTCASALLYLLWYTPLVYPEIPLWLGASIYVPALIWLVIERFRRSEETLAQKPQTITA